MVKGFKLKKERKLLNISFVIFSIIIVLVKGIDDFNTLLFSIILFLIGSFRENVYVKSDGIVFQSNILFIIPLTTVYHFNEASNISFEKLNDGFTVLKFLKGNKLKRIKIMDEDIKKVKQWIRT